jgi:hypothetical protein
MSSPRNRLISFGLILVGLFATAYAIGERLPGHSHTASAGHAHDHSAGGSAAMGAGAGADALGLSSTVGSYRLVLVDHSDTSISVRLDRDGAAVRDFTAVHGAAAHLLLIRRDLGGFQHVHPEIDADGVWTAPIDLTGSGGGAWRVVLETQPVGGDPVVLGIDLLEPGEATVEPLPAPADMVTVGDRMVMRDGLTFTVTPADGLQPWLGQSAHLVAFREGDLAYAHLHPLDDTVGAYRFEGPLPGPGTYRLFLQFIDTGELSTIAFTVEQP